VDANQHPYRKKLPSFDELQTYEFFSSKICIYVVSNSKKKGFESLKFLSVYEEAK